MKARNKDSNVSFVKAMGSPDGLYGPLPEDDWVYRMRFADDPEESVMGWLHAHTINVDHRSLFAQDEHGKPVGPRQLAAYKGWEVAFAESVLLRLERAGRVRRDVPWDSPSTGRKGRGKIWICGHIPAAHADPESLESPGRAKKKGVCTNSLLSKSYVKKQLQALNPDQRKALFAWDREFEKVKPKVVAESIARARGMLDEIQYTAFESFGVKLKRLKKRAKATGHLQVSLVNLPDSVQTPLPPDFVQTANRGLYEVLLPSVQTDAAALVSTPNGAEKQAVAVNGHARAFSDSDSDIVVVGRSVEVRESTDRPTPPDRSQEEEVKELLTRRLGGHLKDEPSTRLCRDILRALKGASLIDLDHRISLKWKKITSFGFVLNLARDVGEAWAKLEALRIQDQQKAEQQSKAKYEAMLKDIREKWQDIDQEERKFYLGHFPELVDAG